MNGAVDRPVEWTIVVLNRGWGASCLLPEARRRADAGEAAAMLVYVVAERRRPRRAWLWHARRTLRRAVGSGGPALATSLTLARSVAAGVGLVAQGTGGAVMIRPGDARHEAQLAERRIRPLPVDTDAAAMPSNPGPGVLSRDASGARVSPASSRPGPGGVLRVTSDVASEPMRLLVPYDGSASTRVALERAAKLARRGDEVSVVNVMPEPGVSSRIGPFVEERRRQAALLEEAARFLSRRGIEAQRVAAVGGVATETLVVAERLGADLIVVAADQGRPFGGVGSPSDRIARRARCDVLVVHNARGSSGAEHSAEHG
jgi:nucleotide-binding universal stress UspA family protein